MPSRTPTTVALISAATTAALVLSACGSNHDDHAGNPAVATDAMQAMTAPASAPTVAPAGAVDKAFVSQMIPHHELAIAMAKAAEAHSRRVQVKALARNIVASQSDEVMQLKQAASRLHASTGEDSMGHGMDKHSDDAAMDKDAQTLGIRPDAMGMSMDADKLAMANPFDRAFLDDMVPHHEGAVRMAQAELRSGQDAKLKALAQRIIAAQQREITEMKRWRSDWYG